MSSFYIKYTYIHIYICTVKRIYMHYYRYVDEVTVLGKCQKCKVSEAEVVANKTSPFYSSHIPKVVFNPCQHMPAGPTCATDLFSCPQCGEEVAESLSQPGLADKDLANISCLLFSFS